jgi:single-strand DNA-binding protein
MTDLNNYSVIGRMTRDLDERAFAYTQNGKARLNISIAVNDGYGDNQYTSYFDVVVWGKTAENIKPYLGRGKQICINGRLRQDRWENNGQKNSRVVIVAETVQLLGGRDNGAGSGGNYQQPAQQQVTEYDNGGEFSEDIPF